MSDLEQVGATNRERPGRARSTGLDADGTATERGRLDSRSLGWSRPHRPPISGAVLLARRLFREA